MFFWGAVKPTRNPCGTHQADEGTKSPHPPSVKQGKGLPHTERRRAGDLPRIATAMAP